MAKILLIASNTSDEPYPVYPLGTAMIASSMNALGHEVAQFDFLTEGASEQALSQKIAQFAPDFVGVSIRNVDNVDSLSSERDWYLPVSRRIVEVVRTQTASPVILGGAGYSLLPGEILDYVGGDYGVAGEGERALGDLIRRIEEHLPSPRIVTGDDGGVLEGRVIPDALWDARVLDYYRPRSVFGIQTKRGCPYRCVYCTYPALEGEALRCREPGAVADEVERLYLENGINRFFFTDSVFNDGNGHYLDVVEEMVRRGLPVKWSAFFCPRKMERSTLALLKRAGLESIEVGTDATSDQTLAGLAKPFGFGDVFALQEVCRQEAIPAAHYVIFGGPEETEASLREGIANVERLKECVVFGFSGIRLFPRTSLYERALKEGLLTRDKSLLKPFHYFSPQIDRQWMEQTIKKAFHGRRDRVFPPGEGQARLKVLHRFGFRGPLWDRLLSFS